MADNDESSGCCGCIVILLFLGALIGLPVTSIYLGVTHLDNNSSYGHTSCPVQPNAPLFLIVLGSITIAYEIVILLQTCCKNDDDSACNCLGVLGWLLTLGFIGWVITGTVWYAKAASQRDGNPTSPDFCNYTLFAFFSSQVIMSCVLVFFLFTFGCCYCCCGSGSGSSGSDPEARNIVPTSRSNVNLISGRPGRAQASPPVYQTIEADRFRAIRNGPNILYVFEKVRVDILHVEP